MGVTTGEDARRRADAQWVSTFTLGPTDEHGR
jgi:hypothetical protein